MSKPKVSIMHSTHLDLYWMGAQNVCLDWGAQILDDVVKFAQEDREFHFMIETVRFLEYYLYKYPEKKQAVQELFATGQLEIGADYSDKHEMQHDGESAVRNVLHGKRVLKKLLGLDTVLSFHPDLPGTSEQTPQIFRKAGIKYYLAARGFMSGARFNWRGLDGKSIIMYNFPRHYSYYNVEKDVLEKLDDVRRAIASKDIVICCSAGDLGAADTFVYREEDGRATRIKLREHIAKLAKEYPELEFRMSGILPALEALDSAELITMDGENPSRWGHCGSALHTKMLMLDKEVSSTLMDAEKYSAICDALSVPIGEIRYERHLLAHGGNSGGTRKYYDLVKTPVTTKDYIETAWEYLVTTQDHNYGGIDGAQTEFDRFIYKNAALTIAKRIKNDSLANISSLIKADQPSVAVFNSMNWARGGLVKLPSGLLDSCAEQSYTAVDSEGKRAPIVCRGGELAFEADDVPSIGYKSYVIEEDKCSLSAADDVCSTDCELTVRNKFYEVVICRKAGVIKRLYDRECKREIAVGDRFLSAGAYEDLSNSCADSVLDKPLLDETVRHVRKVEVKYSDAYETCIEVVTELLNCKLVYEIALPRHRKEIRISPTLYWCAIDALQIKMNLDLAFCPERIVYGVPYGAQTYGRMLEEGVIFKTDEINDALFARYREVDKWIAAESGGFGVCIAANICAYDFDGQRIYSTMMRCVENIGDTGVQYNNKGIHRYQYVITSYAGSWEDGAYRKGWELWHPLSAAAVAKNTGGTLPAERSFLSCGDSGVLTVFAPSESGEGYVARVFNSTSKSEPLAWKNSLGISAKETVDLREEPLSDPLDKLDPYEIKTVSFK